MRIVKTTIEHLKEAALTLSAGDRAEFEAMKPGRNVELVLLRSLGETSRTILDRSDRVIAVGGSRGCLWFVTTMFVQHLSGLEKRQFLRLLKDHLACVRKFSPPEELSNVVHEANTQHVRLLNHLGASWAWSPFRTETGASFRQFWL